MKKHGGTVVAIGVLAVVGAAWAWTKKARTASGAPASTWDDLKGLFYGK